MLNIQNLFLMAHVKSVRFFTYSRDNKDFDSCSSVQEQRRLCTASLSLHWYNMNKDATHHLANANPKPVSMTALQLFCSVWAILDSAE